MFVARQRQDGSKDVNMKSISSTVLTALQVAMALHAVLDLSGAVILFINPQILAPLSAGFVLERALTRIIAGALTAITYSSAVASQFSKPKKFIPLLQFKSVWSTTVWLGLFITIVEIRIAQQSVNFLAWFVFYVFILGSILWNTFLILMRRNAIISKIILALAIIAVISINIINIAL